MFVNFKDVFKEKTQKNIPVPQPLLNYMSNSLPVGLKYEATEHGICRIVADSGETQINDLTFKPTDEQKEVLGENPSYDDVMEYIYNAQQQIQIVPCKEGILNINGNDIPLEKYSLNPMTGVTMRDGLFFLSPPEFPKPFEITVATEKYSRKLKVQRIVSKSVDISKYESAPDEPFALNYRLNRKSQTIQISVSIKSPNTKTVRDLVESASLYNAFLNGTATINGMQLHANVKESERKEFHPKTIAFWEKVLQIESYLGVSFVPPKEDVDFDTMCFVEQLYQSFIFKRPTQEKYRINTLSGQRLENDGVDIKKYIGKQIFLISTNSDERELFGVNLKTFFISGQCNAVLSEYEETDEKYKITFGDLSTEKPFFTASLYFKEEKEMDAFVANNTPLAEDMHKALKPSSYF